MATTTAGRQAVAAVIRKVCCAMDAQIYLKGSPYAARVVQITVNTLNAACSHAEAADLARLAAEVENM